MTGESSNTYIYIYEDHVYKNTLLSLSKKDEWKPFLSGGQGGEGGDMAMRQTLNITVC